MCQNKTKLLPNSLLECASWDVYAMGDMLANQRIIIRRCMEHQLDSMNGNWESGGATERTEDFFDQLIWMQPRVKCKTCTKERVR